jgi:hypothetical protein
MAGVAVGGRAQPVDRPDLVGDRISAVRGQLREHVDGLVIIAGRPARTAASLEPPEQEAISHVRPSRTT